MSNAETSIAERLGQIHEQMDAACRKAGRERSSVALMAVSKTHPAARMREAYAAGQRIFGENRVQEFQQKAVLLSGLEGAEYHLIGPLQTNKSSRAAELFGAIDTVASLRLAERLDVAAGALGKRLPILVEVKLSSEASKHGVEEVELGGLLESLVPLENLVVTGLMSVPPWPGDVSRAGEEARPYFRRLRELRDLHQRVHPLLTELSMGMSNDFAVAIEEGSTCVRIGTALFGRRPPAEAAAE